MYFRLIITYWNICFVSQKQEINICSVVVVIPHFVLFLYLFTKTEDNHNWKYRTQKKNGELCIAIPKDPENLPYFCFNKRYKDIDKLTALFFSLFRVRVWMLWFLFLVFIYFLLWSLKWFTVQEGHRWVGPRVEGMGAQW